MKSIFYCLWNFTEKYIFDLFRTQENKTLFVTGPITISIFVDDCPPKDILKTRPHPVTGREEFYFDGPISRAVLMEKAIAYMRENEARVLKNPDDTEAFEVMRYYIQIGMKIDLQEQRKKLKPKAFDRFLSKNIDELVERLDMRHKHYKRMSSSSTE